MLPNFISHLLYHAIKDDKSLENLQHYNNNLQLQYNSFVNL